MAAELQHVTDTTAPPSGAGQDIWLHATEPAGVPALVALAFRLADHLPGPGVLLTHPSDGAPARLPGGAAARALDPLDARAVAAVIAQARPRVLVLAGGALPSGLIHAARAAGLALVVVDAAQPALAGGWRLLPGRLRSLLGAFAHILVQHEAGARAFRRAGAAATRIEVTGPLCQAPGPLPHVAAEREALATALDVRPVWLAMAVPEAEEEIVLAAQREAQRAAHRLLLILVPADPARGPALAARAAALGLQPVLRSPGEEPAEQDQVYVADTEGEEGLWYRLSPISYLGGTLHPGPDSDPDPDPAAAPDPGHAAVRRLDPYDPAALGSTVICGPYATRHQHAYAALARGRGLWMLGPAWAAGGRPAPGAIASLLARAVGDLLAPDRAAVLAQAAASVATEGTEATDRAVAVIAGLLGRRVSADGPGPG